MIDRMPSNTKPKSTSDHSRKDVPRMAKSKQDQPDSVVVQSSWVLLKLMTRKRLEILKVQQKATVSGSTLFLILGEEVSTDEGLGLCHQFLIKSPRLLLTMDCQQYPRWCWFNVTAHINVTGQSSQPPFSFLHPPHTHTLRIVSVPHVVKGLSQNTS